MQQQQPLFYDNWEDAVRSAITLSGKPAKMIAAELWPSLKMDTAHSRLLNSLSHDKPEKLTLDEIIHVCRLTGRADPLFYMASELHHSQPVPVAPDDEREQLMRQVLQHQQVLNDLLMRVQRTSEGVL